MIKIAYLVQPYVGGTYTRFLQLRPHLSHYGFDFRCIGLKKSGESGTVVEQLEEGVERWHVPEDLPAATADTIKLLLACQYSIVLIPATGSILTNNLPRYLPHGIRCIILAPAMSRTSYRIIRLISDFADMVIAVSDRVRSDLVTQYGLPSEKVVTILSGVDSQRFTSWHRNHCATRGLRAVYLGRLNDYDKGVLLLPKIIRRAIRRGARVVLDVYGSGPDAGRLRDLIYHLGLENTIRLCGQVKHDDVPELLSKCQCILLPSRMEALSNSLLEGMSAGCVPIIHDMLGSMDSIVKDGVSGFVVPVGDISTFADRLAQLSEDKDLLLRMSEAAVATIRRGFSLQKTVEDYVRLFRGCLETSSGGAEPLPLTKYEVPRALRPTWRNCFPPPVKALARKWLVRLGFQA